jgi:hypothetical protein
VVLFAILAGTLGLVVLDSGREERSTDLSSRSAADRRNTEAKTGNLSQLGASGSSGEVTLPARAELGESRTGLFSSHSWQPRVPIPTAAVLSAPTVPPMPYRYAGKVLQGGQFSVLLSNGDKVFPIKVGDTLDGAYRVEAIGESQITLIYLPLKHKETVPVFSTLTIAAAQSDAAARGAGQAGTQPGMTTQAASPAAASPAAASPGRSPAAAGGGAQTAGSEIAQLLWEGPQRVKLGSRFDVALRVTSGQPVHASPMQLRFDPAYLEFVAAKPGKFLGGGHLNFNYRASPDGSIFVGASSRNPAPLADAELLVLTFKSVRPALAAELSVSSLNLQGPAGRPIAFGQPGAFRTAITP